MKYKFERINEDEYELKYGDKSINFKYTVNMAKMMSEIEPEARIKMIAELKKENLTPNDLIITREENGKIIKDNTILDSTEEKFKNAIATEKTMDMIEDTFNTNIDELMNEIGLTTQDEITKFTVDFLSLKTPRRKQK